MSERVDRMSSERIIPADEEFINKILYNSEATL